MRRRALRDSAVLSVESGRSVRLDEVSEAAPARAVDAEPDASVRAVLHDGTAAGGVPRSTPEQTR